MTFLTIIWIDIDIRGTQEYSRKQKINNISHVHRVNDLGDP